MQRIFCTFAMLQATTSEGVRNNTKMQQPVSGMHIAHGLMMHRRSQDFGSGGGPNRKSHAMTSSEIFKKRGQRMKDQKLGVRFGQQMGFC